MASGDTKTEAMLNALGNGGSADEFRGCCNTKTQSYILDAIDRVQNVEDEVEELKNNPDVVDIVDTYADLQAYDTQHLTENDIIRVLQDETHSGNSTYYRFTKNPDTWTFIGEIAGGGGGGVTELTPADYNWPTNNPTSVALWLLPSGVYTATSETAVRANNNELIGDAAQGCFVVGHGVGSTEIVRLYAGEGNPKVYLTTTASGAAMTPAGYKGGKILTDGNLAQTTGASTTDVMSQKAASEMVFSDPVNKNRVTIGNGASNVEDGGVAIGIEATVSTNAWSGTAIGNRAKAKGHQSIAMGQDAEANSVDGIAIGNNAKVTQNRSIAFGAEAVTSRAGEFNIGTGSYTRGYNNTSYRVLGGVHDPVDAHDAATKGYVDANTSPTILYAPFDVMAAQQNTVHLYFDEALTQAVTGGDIYDLMDKQSQIILCSSPSVNGDNTYHKISSSNIFQPYEKSSTAFDSFAPEAYFAMAISSVFENRALQYAGGVILTGTDFYYN